MSFGVNVGTISCGALYVGCLRDEGEGETVVLFL